MVPDCDATQLPDPTAQLDTLFEHLMKLPNLRVVFPECEVGDVMDNIVALADASSSAEVLLSTEGNFRAIDTLVRGIRPTLVNNVLRRTMTPTDIALTRCDVADEILILIALLAEPSNVAQILDDSLAFF